MGYTTEFTGEFNLDRPLAPEHLAYLQAFNNTRRMKRNADLAELLEDPIRLAAGLPINFEGAYFVGGAGHAGQNRDESIIEYNSPPNGQPGLWCQWTPNDEGTSIVWDEGEKFYEYQEWLEYIIANFLAPWGYVLNGMVDWQGEDSDDSGCLVVQNNRVGIREAITSYESIKWADGEDEPDPKIELMAKLKESLDHVGMNLESIDKAMSNDAIPGSIAQAAWECACRHLDEAKGHAANLQTLLEG